MIDHPEILHSQQNEYRNKEPGNKSKKGIFTNIYRCFLRWEYNWAAKQQMLKLKQENYITLYIPLLSRLWGRKEWSSKSMIHREVLSCVISICVGLFSRAHLLHSYFNFLIDLSNLIKHAGVPG